MMLTQILDATALVVLAAQSGWILLLYRRMGRLRLALEGAGAVILQLDEAARRLDGSAGGIVQKVRDGIAEVDSKINACRRVAQELNAASRNAEDVAAKLDQSLRQNRRLQQARAGTPPREMVAPLGLAERLSGPAADAPLFDLLPEPATALAGLGGGFGNTLLQQAVLDAPLLNLELMEAALLEPAHHHAELAFAGEAPAGPGFAAFGAEPRTIRVKLD